MKIAPVADVKARFSSYLEQSQKGPVIVTKNGRPVAAIVSVTDEEELERLVLAHTPTFRRLLDAAEKRIQRRGGLKHNEFWTSVRAKAGNRSDADRHR